MLPPEQTEASEGRGAPEEELLLDLHEARSEIDIYVHDASRIAWNVVVPIEGHGITRYTFELELEIPSNVLAAYDPWAQLQSYARLDTREGSSADRAGSGDPLRQCVLAASSKLARAREGFVRHCAAVRAAGAAQADDTRALHLWITAASQTVADARRGLEQSWPSGLGASSEGNPLSHERHLADEYLSAQHWGALTDCARALSDASRAVEEQPEATQVHLDDVESKLVAALELEIAHRREAEFECPAPSGAQELEYFLQRAQWLKRHFQRVLFLEGQTVQVAERLRSWFAAAAAVIAYLWFFGWQVLAEHSRGRWPVVGSGLVVFALVTAIAYASREKLKEAAHNWLAGRAQSLFAQRTAHYRLPRRGRKAGAVIVTARESFSQSVVERPYPLSPQPEGTVRVNVLRFSHRGRISPISVVDMPYASHVRHIFRYDLSPLFPRLHDAVKGLAVPDREGHRIVIADVPRTYKLPLRASLRAGDLSSSRDGTLVVSKNGLLRFEEEGLISSSSPLADRPAPLS
jgi:hypothetical protein